MTSYLETVVGVVVTTVVGAVTYLIRTVLTNKAELELLKANLVARDKIREEDRQILLELKSDLKTEMRETREDIEGIRLELTQIWKNK